MAFLEQAMEIEARAAVLAHHVETTSRKRSGTIRICANRWSLDHILKRGLGNFLQENPELDLQLSREMHTSSTYTTVPSIGLWFEPNAVDGAFGIEFGTVLYAAYRRAGSGVTGWLSKLEKRAPETADWLHPGSQRAESRTLRIRLSRNDEHMLTEAVAEGIGMAALPRCIGDSDERLERAHMPEADLARTLFTHVHPGSMASPRLQTTIDWLRSAALKRLVGAHDLE